jgi:alginate O-acetyltransferase complex protein AlgJ
MRPLFQPVFQAVRLVLPVLLFGYGIVANLAVLTGPPTPLHVPRADLLAGGLTRDFEREYKTTLPHFLPSFAWIGAMRYALLGEARRGAVVGRTGWLFTAEETKALPSPAQTRAIIEQIQNVQVLLAAQGTDLAVLVLPAKIDIERAGSPDLVLSTNMARLQADFVTGLRAEDITAIDPRSTMMDQTKRVFFTTDTHWTPFGAGLAAKAVGENLPHGSLMFTTANVTIKPLTGDLIRFVTDDRFAPMIGLLPEEVKVSTMTAAAAPKDIFDAAPTDIVLIGTSYSANLDWGFADALSRVLGREVENHAVLGLGPVRPMLTYLQSDDFQTSPAKLVIWEFPIRYLADPWPSETPQAAGDDPSTVASNG